MTLLAAITNESVPFLYLASGNQDIFVTDNRRFVERLTARKIPAFILRIVAPWAPSPWDVWDGQLVHFVDILSQRWRRVEQRGG